MINYLKKRFSLCMAVILVAGSTFTTTMAAPEQESTGSSSVASGMCGNNLTWILNQEGTLIISGTGKMEWEEWREDYSEDIYQVVVEEGVESVCSSAFGSCENLKKVKFSSTVKEIGTFAFAWCSGLTEVQLPAQMDSIGNGAFLQCTGLTDITVPSGIVLIDSSTFSGCSSLADVQLPSGLEEIGSSAFKNCANLKSIQLPKGLRVISRMSFGNCAGLTDIQIPSTVTMIDRNAFEGCTGLTTIVIPASVENIPGNPFAGCKNLSEIRVDENNKCYCVQKGILYNKEITELIACPGTKSGSVGIPASVTSIAYSGFSGCTALSSISLPEGLVKINSNSFRNCTGLKNIAIPSGVTEIAFETFAGCTNLTQINLPANLSSISAGAFDDCIGLTEINLPAKLTEMNMGIFDTCTNLDKINADSNSTVFSSRNGVLYNKNKTELLICPRTKSGKFTVPDNVTAIAYNAFCSCKKLVDIVIPDKVTGMEGTTFLYCEQLETLHMRGNAPAVSAGRFGAVSDSLIIYYPAGASGYDNTPWSYYKCIPYSDPVIPAVRSASNSASGVTVKWSIADGATGYNIYRKTQNSEWKKLISLDGTDVTSYVDKKVTSGTKYWYTVRAVNEHGISGYDKNGKSVVYLSRPDVAVSNASNGVKVKWDKVGGADGYYVYRKKGSETGWTRMTTVKSGSTVSWTDTKAADSGTKYVYTVKAYKKVSDTAYYSAYISGKTIYYLSRPSVSLSNAAKGVRVKWSKTGGASGYYVYRKKGSESKWTRVATIKSGSTVSFTDTKATGNGSRYVYTVKAYKTVSQTTYKGSYISGKNIYRLSQSSITGLKNSASKTFKATWSENTKSSGYQVQYSTSDKFSNAAAKTYSGSSTVTASVKGLSKGKTYYVRVRSYKKVGDTKYYSAWSSAGKVKISK